MFCVNPSYGPISIKDNAPGDTLADNKWHRVIIGRPSRYKHTLMVDGHLSTSRTSGDNYHLDLDGILFLGGSDNSNFRVLGKLPNLNDFLERISKNCTASVSWNCPLQ